MSTIGATWRSAFLTLASFVAVSLIIWPILWRLNQTHLDRVSAEWASLFEICRTSVELDIPLMTAGMNSIVGGSLISRTARNEGSPIFTLEGGRFAAREETSGDAANYRRSCSIELTDDSIPLDKDEIAALLTAFIDLREQLYEAGKHEFRDMDLLPPLTALAFGLRDGNAGGCSTIAYIAVDLATRHANTTIGEQATSACSARQAS